MPWERAGRLFGEVTVRSLWGLAMAQGRRSSSGTVGQRASAGVVASMAMGASEQVGKYVLRGKLATGGMAEVFLARQDGPQGFAKTVVIKRILPHLAETPSFLKMFLDEARLAALINHPNVVSIYELGEDAAGGNYFIAMEYIDGCTIKRLQREGFQRGTPLPFALCARVIADACAGLDFAHQIRDEHGQPLNLIHRDISPENILVSYSGQVKVVDFGIAKASSSEGRTAVGQVKGKFSYMAPEQLLGAPINRGVDIWALGVTLYWLCCGQKPFRGETEGELVQRIVSTVPLPLHEMRAGVPTALSAIAARALTKDLALRYPTARAMQDDLERFIQQSGEVATSTRLSDLMNGLFPEAGDPERVARRSLLSGETPMHTPSGTDVYVSIARGAPNHWRRRGEQLLWGLLPAVAVTMLVVLAVKPLASRGGMTTAAPAAPAVDQGSLAESQALIQTGVPGVPLPAVEPRPPPPASALAAPVTAAEPRSTNSPLNVAPSTEQKAPQRPAPLDPRHHEGTVAESPRARASGDGFLTLRVVPWATVYIDDEKIGTTPFAPVRMSAGTHRVRLVNDEINAARELRVTIQPGRTSSLRIKLE